MLNPKHYHFPDPLSPQNLILFSKFPDHTYIKPKALPEPFPLLPNHLRQILRWNLDFDLNPQIVKCLVPLCGQFHLHVRVDDLFKKPFDLFKFTLYRFSNSDLPVCHVIITCVLASTELTLADKPSFLEYRFYL